MNQKKRNNRWMKHPGYRRARNFLRSQKRFNKLSAKRQKRLPFGDPRNKAFGLVLLIHIPHIPGIEYEDATGERFYRNAKTVVTDGQPTRQENVIL